MDDREELRQPFNREFAHRGIERPVDAMSPGLFWLIVQRGWTIRTRFHIGAEDGRERLDYHANSASLTRAKPRILRSGGEWAWLCTWYSRAL